MVKWLPSFQLESNILTRCKKAMTDPSTHVWYELFDCIYKEQNDEREQTTLRYLRPSYIYFLREMKVKGIYFQLAAFICLQWFFVFVGNLVRGLTMFWCITWPHTWLLCAWMLFLGKCSHWEQSSRKMSWLYFENMHDFFTWPRHWKAGGSELWSQCGRWFPVRSIFKAIILHSWNEETLFKVARRKKEKTWSVASNSTAQIEETGEARGKKSLFEDLLGLSNLRRTGKRPSAKDPATLFTRFSSTSVTSTVK